MFRRYFHFLFFLLLLALPALAQSVKPTMVFVYPGGEGDSEAAQPLLDQFTALIEKQGGPALEAHYYSSLEEGLQAMKDASLGIVSLETYITQKNKIPMALLLSTLPINTDQAEEHYYLMSLEEENLKTVYVSNPMDARFFRHLLFKNRQATPVRSTNLLGNLRKIAEGEKSSYLLDSYEYEGLKFLSFDWIKNLKLTATSEAIPTAPLVVFKDFSGKDKLKEVLLKMGKTSDGKKILQSLRLKGFVETNTNAYEKTVQDFFNPSSAANALPKTPASLPN